jgi:hypothetical protein
VRSAAVFLLPPAETGRLAFDADNSMESSHAEVKKKRRMSDGEKLWGVGHPARAPWSGFYPPGEKMVDCHFLKFQIL